MSMPTNLRSSLKLRVYDHYIMSVWLCNLNVIGSSQSSLLMLYGTFVIEFSILPIFFRTDTNCSLLKMFSKDGCLAVCTVILMILTSSEARGKINCLLSYCSVTTL